jgi:DNA polymerase III subunit delta'
VAPPQQLENDAPDPIPAPDYILPMPIPPLYGHEGIRNRLAGAIASGRLPQAVLLEGPRGVGKQRLALWLAQALLCEAPTGERQAGEPCGVCEHCRRVLGLAHPDLHWFVPTEPSKRAADADKQLELVEEALGEEMAARRARPLYEPLSPGLGSHSIAAVRLLLRRLALKPALGRRKVFIIGDAERLVSQVGAEAAANALLKALEEPPADTVFLLTAAEPEALLPTILSRVVRVRVARLPDSVVTAFGHRELGLKKQAGLAERVAAADGSIGKLLAVGAGEAGSEAAARFLAATERGPGERYALALAQTPFQARGAFTAMLDGLLSRLREQARSGRDTETVVAAIARVLEARGLAQGNVNPQLVTAVLADELAESA